MPRLRTLLPAEQLIDQPVCDSTRDAASLEEILERLPFPEPCWRCPSHDRSGAFRVIAPTLGAALIDGQPSLVAVYQCPFCGVKWGVGLR
jgi:hypothetical protein